ncbi:hypothetical protein GWK91_12815 [Virgibacillus sp. MSP4-1]|uniref:hypothetical protein n=1 Tax=Virgibacillus sp. MSP4-1 TaxID=2700081 RepID=UPI00039E3683|nr:hypothetical protein [Virgibacillus sp. MSP4-1]QHS23776.1 hypothetical protein GWK91_12815 [Virgibacillus sp. MSP4-1]
MEENKGYRRFKIGFHAFLFIFGIVLIAVSVASWNEMNRAVLYLILGLVFAAESIYGLYKDVYVRREE